MLITIENRQFVFAGNLYILTRARHPNVEILKEARKVISNNKISIDLLIEINQKDCECQALKLGEVIYQPYGRKDEQNNI